MVETGFRMNVPGQVCVWGGGRVVAEVYNGQKRGLISLATGFPKALPSMSFD